MRPEPIDLGITSEDFSLETLELAIRKIIQAGALGLRCGSLECTEILGLLIRVHGKYCAAIGEPGRRWRKGPYESTPG
jgi:hypothetical protein